MKAQNGFQWDTPAKWDADVDYITAYYSPADRVKCPLAEIRGKINGEIAVGNYGRASFRHGIEWWGAGQFSLGKRGDECFIRASGGGARYAYQVCEATCTKFSRIDCQTTCVFESAQAEAARRLFEEWKGTPRRAGQPRKARLIEDQSKGQTFYLGSRKSNVLCRLYDHGLAHTSAPAGCSWRFEVECKGRGAVALASLVAFQKDRKAACADYVCTAFSDRGVPTPLLRECLRSEIASPVKTDVFRQFEWLQRQVRPTVGKLCAQGYIEAVVESLGLDVFVSLKR